MSSILAKRNQSAQVRTAQRTAAIQKAKSEKKEKESKTTKVQCRCSSHPLANIKSICEGLPTPGYDGTQNFEAPGEGWKGWPLVNGLWHVGFFLCSVDMYPHALCKIHSPVQEKILQHVFQAI